ncbi:hypothetical protein [Asticcacaulis sp. AND118]|uniref:hypothetical protein n=1 Tax=Asticcacaulis sp. AND118 TaxID=2840468 RepID=UPI001CFFD040|nr:hypothetical protein [Asticcacaulis sp. AND118]UDF04987.1 hypothetical protein LH365_16470 [Asticcacaulis sp. AND118]
MPVSLCPVARHCLLVGVSLLSFAGQPAFAAEGEWLKEQFSVEENAWSFGADYYSPSHENRPIDVVSLEATRSWQYRSGLELQLRGGLMHTDGIRTDYPPDGEGLDSTTTGVTGGLGFRYNAINIDRAHLFVDAMYQVYWSPSQPFPSGGSGINGYLRWGGGLGFDVTPSSTIEIANHFGHISNGGKPPQNPTWEGHGISVNWRRRF